MNSQAQRLEQLEHQQMQHVPVLQSVLDEMGAEPGCVAMNHQKELVVARPEAVYLYTVDGRGPCFVFDGEISLPAV